MTPLPELLVRVDTLIIFSSSSQMSSIAPGAYTAFANGMPLFVLLVFAVPPDQTKIG